MTGVAAIFDVDGTLVKADVLDYYLFLIRRLLPAGRRFARVAAAVLKAPYWLVLDRIDRSRFNESFYRSYEGLPGARVEALSEECFEGFLKKRMLGEVLARLEEHKNRGDRLLLVSGSLDVILKPLARFVGAEACLCPSLAEEEGTFTGRLTSKPVIGGEKAARIRRYADEHGLDLKECYAYADSVSDVPVLELVGHPVAVNPGRALRKEALHRGWEMLSSTLREIP